MPMTGKMRQVEKVPGEGGTVYVFQTTVGERFPIGPLQGSLVEPKMSREQKAALIDVLPAA